jgi:hypothetical protein
MIAAGRATPRVRLLCLTQMPNLCNITHMTNSTNGQYREFRVRKIPDELYKQFKIAAVLKGLSVNEFFLEAMNLVVTRKRGPS